MAKQNVYNIIKKLNNVYLKTFFIVFAIILLIYILQGYVPFGENSLATMDAEIQYLDFFAYLKDVFIGKNSINYSLGGTLGQNMIAVFSYYMSSPLNILVIFFNKINIQVLFNLIVMLKLSIAGITFAYFLKHRFNNNLKDYCVILLSVSYALCQYNLAQASNIMWLDGVYMLPLILLGVYNNVNYKKSGLLILSVAGSVIFNWYTGLINCIFSIIWFALEIAIYEINRKERITIKERIKSIFSKGVRYGIAMIAGGLISAFILLPTAISLQSGRGKLEFGLLKNWEFLGDLLTVIPEYTLGAVSDKDKISLFCGSFALIGCLSAIFTNKLSKRERILFGIFLTLLVLILYWNPFFVVFSLMKDASSYWSRYSYLSIFGILFMSAYFYKNGVGQKFSYNFIKPSLIFALLVILLNSIFKLNGLNRVYLTVAFMIAIILAIIFINYAKNKKKIIKNTAFITLCTLIIFEMAYNTNILMDIYHTKTAEVFSNYIKEGTEQIETIKNIDDSFYRISQTSTRNVNQETNLTANYNEPIVFGYWGISSYTSDPDEKQRRLLHNLGYRINGDNMNIVNTSILGADSLLGVKYILSEYQINGLEKLEIPEKNGKNVYKNPYALPLAFTYKDNNELLENSNNPFEYQNKLYSKLLNKDVELYVPINYSSNEKIENGKVIKTYNVQIPEGNYAIYGNLFMQGDNVSTLNVSDEYSTGYFCWLAPSVFYIPTSGKSDIAKIELTSNISCNIEEEQFYALKLDVLKEITNKITENKANIINMENGKIYIEAKSNSEKGQDKLFLSLPYDEGWEIIVNGKKVEPELLADCLMTIPLENGNNSIEMNYKLPYFKVSVIITTIGIFMFICIVIYERKDKLHGKT